MKISKSHIDSVMIYNKEEGRFYWTVYQGKAKPGQVVGCMSSNGYLSTKLYGIPILLHHLVWFYEKGIWPKMLDHINRDKTDNRIGNLRETNPSLNAFNAGPPVNNVSGYRGVSYCKQTGRWRASIMINGTAKNLGRYLFIEEAIKARQAAEENITETPEPDTKRAYIWRLPE